MTSLLKWLAESSGADVGEAQFEPIARYYGDMDFVLYLNSDVSYRAERVDVFLTVLWHPTEHKLVGIKLKGFKFIFERLKNILQMKDDEFIPLVKALEIALVGGLAENMMASIEDEKKAREFYKEAMDLAKDVSLPVQELAEAA